MNNETTITQEDGFTEEQQEGFRSIRTSRILIPILIGIGVVVYILLQQFNLEDFSKIKWTQHTLFWISVAVLFIAIRHFAYMARLYILTEGAFNWRKCFELIFIWEFSSAISPTSIGGSAVAFFMLSQEKLSMAKTAAIVTYTIVLDALFFVISLPIIYLIFGKAMLGTGVKFIYLPAEIFIITVYIVIIIYGALFAYGLFRNPKGLKNFFIWVCKIPFLRRFQEKAEELGGEIILASQELKTKSWNYHLGGFMSTVVAWLSRFLILGFLFIAFVPAIQSDFYTNSVLFSRIESMFLVMLYSPSPGGAGFTELFFFPFFKEFIPQTVATTIVIIWRLLTYYSYLFIGVIIVPNWIKNVINRRRREKHLRVLKND